MLAMWINYEIVWRICIFPGCCVFVRVLEYSSIQLRHDSIQSAQMIMQTYFIIPSDVFYYH